jgi:hypothetical protein
MLDCKGGGKITYTFSANANVLSVQHRMLDRNSMGWYFATEIFFS